MLEISAFVNCCFLCSVIFIEYHSIMHCNEVLQACRVDPIYCNMLRPPSECRYMARRYIHKRVRALLEIWKCHQPTYRGGYLSASDACASKVDEKWKRKSNNGLIKKEVQCTQREGTKQSLRLNSRHNQEQEGWELKTKTGSWSKNKLAKPSQRESIFHNYVLKGFAAPFKCKIKM